MDGGEKIKVIELRNYLLKPNLREQFIDYFENHFVASQNELGGYVLGQFEIKNKPDRFFWIRGFESMSERSRLLPAFYGGEVWREFGPAANEMMLEWHNVHLLKPLGAESLAANQIAPGKGVMIIDFYKAQRGRLSALAELFQANCVKEAFPQTTFWVSELAENDFPRLPVIQNKNLLVAISVFKKEADFRKAQKQLFNNLEFLNRLGVTLANHQNLRLFPTPKSFLGNISHEKI